MENMQSFNATILVGSLAMVIVSLLRQRTLFTPGVLFSGAWLIVLISNQFMFISTGVDFVPPLSYEVQSRVLVFAFAGFFVAQLLLARPRGSADEVREQFKDVEPFIRLTFHWVLAGSFVTGLAAFVSAGANFSFSFNDLRDIRKSFIGGDSYTIWIKIAVYWFSVHSTYFILLALNDFVAGRPRLSRLAVATVVILPLAMAKGSRIEFVIPIIYYIITYWTLLSTRTFGKTSKRKLKTTVARLGSRGAVLAAAIALLFAAYGNVRNIKQPFVDEATSAIDTTLISVGSYLQGGSLISVGPITEWLDQYSEPTGGQKYFEVFYKVPVVLGLVESKENKSYVRDQYDELGNVVFMPGSMTRHLTSEFGLGNAPLAAFLLTLLSSFALLRLKPMTIPAVVFVSLVSFDIFYSFHKVGLFSMDNAYRMFFATFIYFVYDQFLRSRQWRLRLRPRLREHAVVKSSD